MDLFIVAFFVSLALLRIFTIIWDVLVVPPLNMSSLNTRRIFRINVIWNYSLPIIWVAILLVLLIFSNSLLFLTDEFVLIISAAFLIPYVFTIFYGAYLATKPKEGQSSLTLNRVLTIIFVAALVPIQSLGRLLMFITVIRKNKILISSGKGDSMTILPTGKEFDRFFTGQVKKINKITSQFSNLIITLGTYVPLTLASYFFLEEEGLSINRVTMFGIFMIIFGLINHYSTRPTQKGRFGLSDEEGCRVINPLLKSSFFIGIILIPAMFVWAGFFQLGLTVTYIVLFAGLSFLSILAREKITIKGNISLQIMESSGMDFQTYVPRQMVSGSLIMALVVYPFLKAFEVFGTLNASAEILTIAIGAFYAAFISLLVMIIMARNMSDPKYLGSRDSLARNSLLYLYVFISVTFFGTILIGITPSSIIVHNFNQNLFNTVVIFASGAILYLGIIEVPYRLGAQRYRDKNLQEQTEQLVGLEQQLDHVFSKKLLPDLILIFYQRERLKSRIDELKKTPISLFRKLPLPAAIAAFLSGILMEIAVPRFTEVIGGILGT